MKQLELAVPVPLWYRWRGASSASEVGEKENMVPADATIRSSNNIGPLGRMIDVGVGVNGVSISQSLAYVNKNVCVHY